MDQRCVILHWPLVFFLLTDESRATDDGRCVFDIYARDEEGDQASMNEFGRAATSLVHSCVSGGGARTEGGIVTGIGT